MSQKDIIRMKMIQSIKRHRSICAHLVFTVLVTEVSVLVQVEGMEHHLG
jgi:hypothetical protein